MHNRAGWLVGVITMGLVWGADAMGGPPALLELRVKDSTQQGKLVAMDQTQAWLMTRDGQLNQIKLSDVTEVKRVSARFDALSSAEMRDALRREFGRGFEVAGSEHYLVCAPPGKAREYVQLFEEIYRSFHGYFAVRGFKMTAPEFPLVAIVFPDRQSFDGYCQRDGFRAFPGLMGYYLRTANRVALFDPSGKGNSVSSRSDGHPLAAPPFVHGSIQAGLADTMIHEATHQVAFNTSLHSRVGVNPKWIVEGLATVFEAPGIRDAGGQAGLKIESRLNRERFTWFRNFAESRRASKSLETFIANDETFQSSALDAYSQAWALSFYLIETRPGQYARYLKTIATRDPMRGYDSTERLADFRKAFGNDLTLLEADFLRFMERLD